MITVMAIYERHHPNMSKHGTLLDEDDISSAFSPAVIVTSHLNVSH